MIVDEKNSCHCANRNLYGDGCSAALNAGNRDAPAEEPRTLGHAEQAESPSTL